MSAEEFSEKIQQALAVLPDKPGVYLMHDANGKVIYVGKAVVLKNRVRSYFRNLASHTPKVKAMVEKIAEIETIVTSSEVEALILECNLIKKYRPRYNIMLKDDKTYPFLKVTMNEDFPRIYVTRRQARDGAKYYGPYADVGAMHDTVKLLRECDAGVKRGTKSIDDVIDYVKSSDLRGKLTRCMQEHNKLGEEIEELLSKYHDDGKNPNPIAAGMSWMKTNVKLAMHESDNTIADLMTDGCNMGVKSLNKYLNQYEAADELSKDITKRLINVEEKLAIDIREFL